MTPHPPGGIAEASDVADLRREDRRLLADMVDRALRVRHSAGGIAMRDKGRGAEVRVRIRPLLEAGYVVLSNGFYQPTDCGRVEARRYRDEIAAMRADGGRRG